MPHEEDIDGSFSRGDASGFDGLARLCLARRLGPGYWPRLARRRHHRRRDRLQPLSLRLLRRSRLLRPGLCRWSLWTLLMAAFALLGWLWLGGPQRAGLRVIRSATLNL